LTVADSGALRQQRYKHHRAGDHHLCRHPVRPGLAPFPPSPQRDGDLDPETELRRLAGRLTAAHEHDPSNAAIARELRVTLQVLIEAAEAAGTYPDAIDIIRAASATPDQRWRGA
jgi:hypothetical protein